MHQREAAEFLSAWMYVSVLIVTAIAAAIFLQELEQTLRQVAPVVLEHVDASNQVVYLLANVYVA